MRSVKLRRSEPRCAEATLVQVRGACVSADMGGGWVEVWHATDQNTARFFRGEHSCRREWTDTQKTTPPMVVACVCVYVCGCVCTVLVYRARPMGRSQILPS